MRLIVALADSKSSLVLNVILATIALQKTAAPSSFVLTVTVAIDRTSENGRAMGN